MQGIHYMHDAGGKQGRVGELNVLQHEEINPTCKLEGPRR